MKYFLGLIVIYVLAVNLIDLNKKNDAKKNQIIDTSAPVSEPVVLPKLEVNKPKLVKGMVAGVNDGDTITVLTNNRIEKIRLYGIDAPETNGNQEYAQLSRDKLIELLLKKHVEIDIRDIDKYQRKVSIVYVENENINETMVKLGLAHVYGQYCNIPICSEWYKYQSEAKTKKLGLWQDSKITEPWRFRKELKALSRHYKLKNK